MPCLTGHTMQDLWAFNLQKSPFCHSMHREDYATTYLCLNTMIIEREHDKKKASRQKKDNMCKMQTCLEFDNCNHLLNSGNWVFVTLLMGQEGE